MSWTSYKPFKNDEYNTIWELARQLVDEYRQEYPTDPRSDDDLIQHYGIPYLCRWIFTDAGTQNLVDLSRPEWDEFMRQFILRFLNMEIYALDPRVWRRSVAMKMLEYREYIEESANVFYESLKGAGATTTSTRKASSSGTQTGDSSEDGTETDKASSTASSKGESARAGKTSSTSSGKSETSSSSSGSSNGTTTDDRKDTTSGSNSQRVLNSDMPQSNVSAATVGNPELETWTYASAMQDTNGKNDTTVTGASSTTHADTDESNTSTSGTNSATQSGEDSTNETRSDSSESASNNERKTSRTGSTNNSHSDTSDETSTSETMSAFELTKEKYEFFREHMQKPLYTVLDKCYKYFISTYPDEERLGFLEWDAIAEITSKVKETGE